MSQHINLEHKRNTTNSYEKDGEGYMEPQNDSKFNSSNDSVYTYYMYVCGILV